MATWRRLTPLVLIAFLVVALWAVRYSDESETSSWRALASARFVGVYSANTSFYGPHSLSLRDDGTFTYTFPPDLFGRSFVPRTAADRMTAMSRGRWRLAGKDKIVLTHTHRSAVWDQSVEDAGQVQIVPVRELPPGRDTIAILNDGALRYYYSTDERDGRNCELTRE